VLVIGVDGVRFDLLGPEVTPVIWSFTGNGFLGPVPVDETTPTWSGPCWATIATGTGVEGHGITFNDLTGHRLAEHPDFVTVATRAGVPTLLAVSGWPPLALAEDGGREPVVTTAWAAAAGPGIPPGDRALITSQAQVAPLVLDALGDMSGS
jgi:hypothetical protein